MRVHACCSSLRLLTIVQYAPPRFEQGEAVDLTLEIGAYGEHITLRNLQVKDFRRSQYSGRLEYRLSDDERNRIDYTRWFDENTLTPYEATEPDPTCKRTTRLGRPCSQTPTFPSGMCIRHKAKLDWDRARQRRKLEEELALREHETEVGEVEVETIEDPKRVSSTESVHQQHDDTASAHTLVDGTSSQVSTMMWGEADLFERTLRLNSPPTYRTNLATPLPTPGMQLQLDRVKPFRTCIVLMCIAAFTVTSSLAVALWWSVSHDDPQSGFTIAGYIVAAGGIIMYPIQSQHSKHCTCWKGLYSPSTT